MRRWPLHEIGPEGRNARENGGSHKLGYSGVVAFWRPVHLIGAHHDSTTERSQEQGAKPHAVIIAGGIQTLPEVGVRLVVEICNRIADLNRWLRNLIEH